jgi:hypothetical protein
MANGTPSVSGAFDPAGRDGLAPFQTLALAGSQNVSALAQVVSRFGPSATDFVITVTSDTAAALVLLDLTARGMTLPTGFSRLVWIDAVSVDADEMVYKSYVYLVVGGTNPTVFDSQALFNTVDTDYDTELIFDVAINTTPTPDTVEVRIATVPAVSMAHRVYVSVSPLFPTIAAP